MISKPKGTVDILGEEVNSFRKIEDIIRRVCRLYNVEEIRTPIFESSDLIHRDKSDTSDLVTKETYDFVDRGNRKMTLRPEGTASVVRSYIENKMYVENPVTKLFYIGPMFRYERPQKGRLRQFHQFGVEMFGSDSPLVDAEGISLCVRLIKALGLKGVKVKLNTIGDEESRSRYKEVLIEYFNNHKEDLCNDCLTRLEKNPLRILDCKVDNEKDFFLDAPIITDYLNEESINHFETLKKLLDDMEIDYEVSPRLVRGLDYYTKTVFEVMVDVKEFGAQNVICGGGRYDNLVGQLGGPKTSAFGLAFGLERLVLALNLSQKENTYQKRSHLYILTMGEEARMLSSKLLFELRNKGLVCDMDYLSRSMKAQFKQADKENAMFTVIIGENEVNNNTCNIKNNETDEQVTINICDIFKHVTSFLNDSKCHSCKEKGCSKHE